MQIKQEIMSSNRHKYKAPYAMTPEGIVVHNTYNDATARNEIAYMIRNNNYTSFHIAVDDIEAIQSIPFNRNSFSAGDGAGAGNRKHIAIEICYSKSGGAKFIKAEQNAAKVVARILKQYNWGINKVKKHQDFSGKYCPHRTLDMGWQRFLNMVSKELGQVPSINTGGNTVSNVYYGVNSKYNTKIAVQKLQNDLLILGYAVGTAGADGVFGSGTRDAVLRLQKAHGLAQDGLAGKSTLDKIKSLVDERNKPKPIPTPIKELYRVRLTWDDAKSQKNAYHVLQSAIDEANKYDGYSVYNEKGIAVHTNVVRPIPPKPEIKPVPVPTPPAKPTNNDIAITGKSIATAKQMEKALLSKNKNPKIKISALEFCKLFLEEGEVEGIRGDIAFCQAMKETGWLSYGGQVLPEQNNYAGIGATNNSAIGKGNWFDTERLGIRAQIQHLKAYGNKESLVNENIDPRFRFVTRGIAPNWIDLNGRWAVPGTTYGQDIVKMYIELIEITIKEDESAVDKSSEYLKEIKELKEELAKAYATIEKIKSIVVSK